MIWYSYLFKNFLMFFVIHRVKGFCVVNKTQIGIFLEFSCFLQDPMNVGNLISGSSAFSKPSFYICKFLVHVLLKLSLKDFEHNLASMWNEYYCMVVQTFFGIALLLVSAPISFYQMTRENRLTKQGGKHGKERIWDKIYVSKYLIGSKQRYTKKIFMTQITMIL